METDIEIIPKGVKIEPLFKTDEDYQKFRDEYSRKVIPELEKWERARALSCHEAQNRLVD